MMRSEIVQHTVSSIQHLVQRRLVVFLLGMALLAVPHIASAHKVSVFAWVEGNTVYVQSKFGGGRKPKGAPVEVYNDRGDLILSGVTNDQGEFSFKVKAKEKTEMKIVLLAGMGHRAEWTIPAGDFDSDDTQRLPQVAPPNTTPVESDAPMQMKATVSDSGPSRLTDTSDCLTADEIQTIIDGTLDRKLKPVMKMLAESRDSGPSIRDILGGIGYILGLVGIAMYFRYRRK